MSRFERMRDPVICWRARRAKRIAVDKEKLLPNSETSYESSGWSLYKTTSEGPRLFPSSPLSARFLLHSTLLRVRGLDLPVILNTIR
eukprot:6181032-Pleurochrysis_carterae.AAC.1